MVLNENNQAIDNIYHNVVNLNGFLNKTSALANCQENQQIEIQFPSYKATDVASDQTNMRRITTIIASCEVYTKTLSNKTEMLTGQYSL